MGKPFGMMSQDELATITEIQAAGRSIGSLRGIEYCKRLEILNLRSNDIESISFLEDLDNLTWLDLGDNQIKNISPVQGLTSLTYINLWGSGNDFFDYVPLVTMVQQRSSQTPMTIVLDYDLTHDDNDVLFSDLSDEIAALENAAEVEVVYATASGEIQ